MNWHEDELVVTGKQQSGIVLVIVICFTAIIAVLSMGMLTESMTQVKIAKRQINMEKAFYISEGGAEQAVTYIRTGGAIPGMITGTIGNGKYVTSILAINQMSGTGGTHTALGDININPNNSPDNEFMLVTSDGIVLNRDDLHQDQLDYTGVAYLLHVKPKGNGNQNSLTVDGIAYTLNNNTAYTFSSAGMTFNLYNSNRNPQGSAVGQWFININGLSVSINDGSISGTPDNYSIFSIGMVNGVTRVVILEGIHQQSWSKYALWYNTSGGAIWIRNAENFLGPVHANTTLYLDDTPTFHELLSTTAAGWGSGSDLSGVTFMQSYEFNAAFQSMASINFTNTAEDNCLRDSASLIITGETYVTLSGSNVLISNSNRGWSDYNCTTGIPGFMSTGELVYVETGGGQNGNLTLGGNLDGRLTFAVDNNIYITNHTTYAVHPTNDSDDALGLIAGNDVVVSTLAPDNLNIFAHIIAACSIASYSHGFFVQNYASRHDSGNLNVYGGIVEYTRGAVGTSGWWGGHTGYYKQYQYDTRFLSDPPPYYPQIADEYLWSAWRDKAP